MTELGSTSLSKKAAKGAAWSIGGNGAATLIQVVAFAVLARLLPPADFGLYAMVVAIVGIGELFRDFGLTNAAIQSPTLSSAQQSNLFWTNTAIGGSLTVISWFLAGSVAGFYQNQNVQELLRALSLSFLINSAAAQPRASLLRDLKIRHVAIINVIGSTAGLLAGVAAALSSLGFWSIAVTQLSKSTTISILSYVSSGFVLSLPNPRVTVRPFIGFGAGMLGAQLLIHIGSSLPNILIGRYWGAGPLGFFSRSLQLAFLPVSSLIAPMSQVSLPVLSRLNAEPAKYDAYLLRGQTAFITSMTVLYSLAVVFADIVIRVALGAGWESSIVPFKILCVAGLMESVHSSISWIYVSKGIPSRYFHYSILTRALSMTGVWLAVPHGIVAVAWACAVWATLSWPVELVWIRRWVEIPTVEIFALSLRLLGFGAILTGVGTFVRMWSTDLGLGIQVTIALLTMVAAAGVMFAFGSRLRTDFNSLRQAMALALKAESQ